MVAHRRLGRFRQYSAGIITTLGAAIAGQTFTWFEPLSEKLIHEGVDGLLMSAWELALVVATMELANTVAIIPMAYIARRYGRKFVCWSLGPLAVLSYAIIILTKSLTALFIARIIHGIVRSICISITAIYIAETASPDIRGSITSIIQTMFFLGSLYSYILGRYLSYNWYAAGSMPLSLLYTVGLLFFPKTPYWLLQKGRREEARRSLSWLRGKDDVTEELDAMQSAVKEEMGAKTTSPWKTLLLDPYERKAFLLLQVISITKSLSGIGVITTYTSEIFSTGFNFLTPSQMTITIGVLLALLPLIPAVLTDRFGRKYLLIFSTFGSFICHSLTGLYFFLFSESGYSSTHDPMNYVWMLYVGITGYCFCFATGIGTLLGTLQSEVFGSQTREIAGSITQIASSVIVFATINIYRATSTTIGQSFHFWLYGFTSLLGGIYFVIYMFETASKPIGRMGERETKDGVKSEVITYL